MVPIKGMADEHPADKIKKEKKKWMTFHNFEVLETQLKRDMHEHAHIYCPNAKSDKD